ncbi:MAG TPA: heterodisulfide reductase-related iron-sulfur binding cluster, partial [Methanobacterium sp.]|nr:heterodisulfide reductase-related iron-sulfur binding cluster [Methanobacterium sp.]
LDKLQEAITNPLNLYVAVHYGCHFLKPSAAIGIDDPMKPTILDELVEVTGAKSIDYKDKMMCCGAGGGLRSRDLDVTLDYTKEKLDNMIEAGVDIIVNVCPFCHLQFDVGQKEVNKKYGTDYNIPVFHLAQLYGLAMGLSREDITIDAQQISAEPAMAKLDEMTGGE